MSGASARRFMNFDHVATCSLSKARSQGGAMTNQFSLYWIAAAVLFLGSRGAYASPSSVTWEQQAERLQVVSASLLDAVPVTVLPPKSLHLGVSSVLSLLPEVNPRVGGKSEKVPSSPVHTVPMIQLGYGLGLSALAQGTARVWGGYLPSGLEGVFGVKAELSQWAVGAALGVKMGLGLPPFVGDLGAEMGMQLTSASLSGAITEPEANDEFETDSRILFLALGLHPEHMGLHAAFLVASKQTTSRFVVSSSRTELEVTDKLSDASPPLVMQAQIGAKLPFGLTLGFAELWVPERLLMPRLFGQFEYVL